MKYICQIYFIYTFFLEVQTRYTSNVLFFWEVHIKYTWSILKVYWISTRGRLRNGGKPNEYEFLNLTCLSFRWHSTPKTTLNFVWSEMEFSSCSATVKGILSSLLSRKWNHRTSYARLGSLMKELLLGLTQEDCCCLNQEN